MGNILYVVAVILVILWAISFKVVSTLGGIIKYMLLVIAVIAIILRLFLNRRTV